MDVLWLIKSKNMISNFKNWSDNLFSKNHHMQDIDFSDLLPFFSGTLSALIKQINPKFRKQKTGMN